MSLTSVKAKPQDNSVVVLNKLRTDQVHVFGRNMGVKGNPITVANDDLETTPSSEESMLTRLCKGDDNLSTLMEQGKAMVALLQSSVDEQKKETDEQRQHHKLTEGIKITKATGDMDELKCLLLELNKTE